VVRPDLTRRAALVLLATACAATLALADPARSERKPGIDVSRFQSRIDWQRVGETELEFAFVQASRGSGLDCAVEPTRCGPDEFYDRNYARARENGIRVGPYHRAFAGGEGRLGVKRDSRREAKVFLAEVGELRPEDLLPVLDVETPFGGLDPRELRIWIRNWLTKVEKELDAKPIIYTNYSSWQATGDTTSFARQGHPLWVANFDVASPKVPALNWSGLGWSIWQYTNSGSVPGIAGDVDRDVARVSLDSISVRGG
jgi:GH25 family lysozyme M1 (1,4-beta-N-acetylmuramidase)